MAKLIIEGGHTLKGQIAVQGAKNAALPILAAAMLVPEPVRIINCPRLTDVEHMAGLLRALGCRVEWAEDGLVIDAGCAKSAELPEAAEKLLKSADPKAKDKTLTVTVEGEILKTVVTLLK